MNLDSLSGLSGALAAVIGTAAYLLIGLRFLSVYRRHPRAFSIALVGFPGSGKTVYATTAFDLLQQGRSRWRVRPYGIETAEEVARNLNTLARGEWLPRTKEGTFFFFRAIVEPMSRFQPRLKLEIADFPGEDLDEMQPASDRWLHRGKYFKYVVDSDAVFFCIDAPSLLGCPDDHAESILNALITCLHVLTEHAATSGGRLRAPVAVLLMKADKLDKGQSSLLEERVNRFEAVCRQRCLHHETFLVSSTGPFAGEVPKAQRHPVGVLEPIDRE